MGRFCDVFGDDLNLTELEVVVEIPAGSRNKFEYDERFEGVLVPRCLPEGMRYSFGYGFVPGTLSGDGDPLDVVVIGGGGQVPSTRLVVSPLGILWTRDEHGCDPKLITAPVEAIRRCRWSDIEDLPADVRRGLVEFFRTYKCDQSGANIQASGFGGVEAALVELARSRARHVGEALDTTPTGGSARNIAPTERGRDNGQDRRAERRRHATERVEPETRAAVRAH